MRDQWESVHGTPSTVTPSKENDEDEVGRKNERVFWSVARPVALLAVFGGISPYPWPRKKSDVSWKWQRRWPTIIHFLLLATYIVILICKTPPLWVKIMSTDPTQRATAMTMTAIILGTPWINYIWIQVKVYNIWKLLHLFSQLRVCIDTKLKKYSVILVVGCFLISLVEQFPGIVYWRSADDWYDWFYFILSLHALFLFNFILVQITFLAIIVRSQLQCFNARIMEICSSLCSSTMVQHDLSVRRDVTFLADLFFELSHLVENMDNIYGTSIMITYLIFVVWITSCLFYLLVVHMGKTVIYISTATVIVAVISSMVTFTGILGSIPRQSTTSLTRLIEVNRLVSNPHIKSQIEALIQKMTGPPIEITAASYFAINRGLMTAVLGAVTTYLIVLAQFKGAEAAMEDGKDASLTSTIKTTIATTQSD